MKKISSKPTVYLIDGSNFSMRFWEKAGGESRDELERGFMQWLADAAKTEALRASCFRVVFDGPFRPSGARGASITVYYSDSEPADEMLVERGYYMQNEGIRAIIVTSDNGLRERAAAEGVKTMNCETFQRLADAELRKESR
jgi:predicted RNA-binding protein with PIN domain